MSFEEILLNAIDEEFSSLGEICQKIIYFYLKNEYTIDRQEIPSNIKVFSQAIESMFKDGFHQSMPLRQRNIRFR